MTASRRRRDEAGFTLVELLISIAIISIITPALAGVVIAYLKNTTTTQSRLAESHDVQFATAYWQRDVASIGVRAFDAATKSFPLQQSVGITPACTLPAGTPVTTLGWTRYDPAVLVSHSPAAAKTVTVSYVSAPKSGGAFTLTRVRCEGGSITSQVQVADTLDAAPTVTCSTACTGAGGNVPRTVTLNLVVRDVEGGSTTSYTAALRGDRRQS